MAAGFALGEVFTQSDSTHYLRLAAGLKTEMPFASRQLGPLLVHTMTRGGLSTHQGFVALGIASLLFLCFAVAFLLFRARDRAAPEPWLIWAVMGIGFWAEQFNGLVLPDLFYAALLGGFLLLLWARRYFFAAFLLFPLALTRESTALLLICFLVAGWGVLRRGQIGTALISTGAGFVLVSRLAANAAGNREGISPGLYLLAKLPWNFLKNFLGILPWANVYPACPVPAWHRAVHLGPLHEVGYCGLSWEWPVRLVASAAVSFGLFPLLLIVTRAGWRRAHETLLIRFCLVYGVVSFLLAGLVGTHVQRLFQYAWPLFLVGLPLLVTASGWRFRNGRWAVAFLGVHFCLSWAGVKEQGWQLLVAAAVGYGLGYWMLRAGGVYRPATPATHSPAPAAEVLP